MKNNEQIAIFNWTRREKAKLWILFLIKRILGEVYELDLKNYVDLMHVSVNGSFFHLLTVDPTLCDFVITKEAISEQGHTLEGITHKEWDISFYALFTTIFPNREVAIRSLVESSNSYFSSEYIEKRWQMISQGIKKYGVREEAYQTHLCALPYLVKSENCVAGHFLGSKAEALGEGEENSRAKAAAALAKAGGADLGIGIIHTKDDSTVICINGKNGIVSTVLPHTAIPLDPEEQIPRVVVEQIAILLENHFDVHSTLSFRL